MGSLHSGFLEKTQASVLCRLPWEYEFGEVYFFLDKHVKDWGIADIASVDQPAILRKLLFYKFVLYILHIL